MLFAPVAASVEGPRTVRHVRRLAALVAVPTVLLGWALVIAPSAHATVAAPGPAGSLTWTFSDGSEYWYVPTGVYSVSITAAGGSGENGHNAYAGAPGGAGGHGALVTETVPVVPGERLDLDPGSAGNSTVEPGWSFAFFGYGGAGGSGDTFSASGGRGGGNTVVWNGNTLVAIAGGGGGGGGGGVVAGYTGGSGGSGGHTTGGSGADGSGTGWGPGGTGNRNKAEGTSSDEGEDAASAPRDSSAGGGGGGGGGYDGYDGGGHAGAPGGSGGGGGGGGAGGTSLAEDPNATFGVAPGAGDGYLILNWTPGLTPTSALTGPASVLSGDPVTLTDTISSSTAGAATATGTVSFVEQDPNTGQNTTLGTVPLSGGKATLSAPLIGGGSQPVHALYSGDATYFPSTSDFVYIRIVPILKTLSITPDALDFGDQLMASFTSRDLTLTNTGTVDLSVTGVTSDYYPYVVVAQPCATLAPGASCTVTVQFLPPSVGPSTATLTVTGDFTTTSGDVDTTTVGMTGTGVLLPASASVSPDPLAFGDQAVGTTTSQNVTITNTGEMPLSGPVVTSNNPAVQPGAQCDNLASGASCTLPISFAPTAAGPVDATVTVGSNFADTSFEVTGNGVPQTTTVTVTPTLLRFGNVAVGKSPTKTVTLTNTGTGDWAFSSVSSANPAFVVTKQPCATLAPGAHCTATVAFRPSASGPMSTTLSFTGNSGTTSITVSGTGVQAPPVVTGISPNHGSPRGGTRVTITGRALTGVTAIRIGAVAMRSVSCTSSTRCTAVTPASSGTKDIRVVTPGGTSAVVPADRFTFRS